MASILIIDDDENMCQSLSHVVRRAGHEAACSRNLTQGWERAAAGEFDVIFLDVRLPDGNGLELLPRLQGLPVQPEVIIMTGFGDSQGAELAIRCGAWDYIEKSASVKVITLSLSRALEYRKQKMAVRESHSVVALKRDAIIGTSQQLKACLDRVATAAACDASVLVTGETGTGKELFARAVHENSGRADKEFVVVDCAAMPENLIECMLFGHERGAFTSADQAREGLLRQANGGTLFLDEVGELPLALQKAFLRVLQEHRFRPIGSSREVTSDFRVVAATNRNLEEMVKSGMFRQDLLFRLRSFVIELPPLRERPEDLKELVRFHVDRFCERYHLTPKGFAPEFVTTLTGYPWPGNVRELVNAVEQAVMAAGAEPVLFPKHLPADVRVQAACSSLRSGAAPEPACGAEELLADGLIPPFHQFRETACAEAERHYLRDLMSSTRHSISEACRISGLSPSRLYALLKSHRISTH